MTKKESVIRIWRECFDDSEEYVDMYFNRVYRDDEAIVLQREGTVLSALLLQRYAMNFHGVDVAVSYICGAGTVKSHRCHGYMSQLIYDALRESYCRGDMFCALIPASDYLFNYYGHFGFSPIFWTNVEHYTSLHTFKSSGNYVAVDDISGSEAYAFFSEEMSRRNCCVQHTAHDYANILVDNALDGGRAFGIADMNGHIAAMAFVVTEYDETVVKDILARDDDAREAMLQHVLNAYPGSSIKVLGYYSEHQPELLPRGMGRIVDVENCLRLMASRYDSLNLTFKINDGIVPENSHIYRVSRGRCVINDEYDGHIDYDIDVEVLTSIVFGNDVTRRLLDFPAERPFISLMLD